MSSTGVTSLFTLLITAPLFSSLVLAEQSSSTPSHVPIPIIPLHPNDTASTASTASAPANSSLRIVDDDSLFHYAGCWTETTPLPDSRRALDGPFMSLAGSLTVPICLHFCGTARNRFTGERGYRFGGLEHAQECWCGDSLSNRSYHLSDSACSTPCDGSNTTACGGNLAISLYQQKDNDNEGSDGNGDVHGPGDDDDNDSRPADEAVIQAVGVGLLVLTVTFALGLGCL